MRGQQITLALICLLCLAPGAMSGSNTYRSMPENVEDRIAGGREIDLWAEAYKKGKAKEAEKYWKIICDKVKPYDGFESVLKLAHMRFMFEADENKSWDNFVIDQDILKSTEAGLGPNHPAVGDVLNFLCLDYMNKGQWKQAEAIARRRLAIYVNTTKISDVRRPSAMRRLADILKHENKKYEAQKLIAESVKLDEKYPHEPTGNESFKLVFPEAIKNSKKRQVR